MWHELLSASRERIDGRASATFPALPSSRSAQCGGALFDIGYWWRFREGGDVPESRFRQGRRGGKLERFPPLRSRRIDQSMNAALRSEQERQSLNFRIPGHLFPKNGIERGRDFQRCLPRNRPFRSLDDPRYGTERIGPLPRHHYLGNTLSK